MAETGYSRWRWFLGVILLLGVLGESLLWFAPSPVLTVIMADLQMDLVWGGLLVSIVCLGISGMSLLSAPLVSRVDAKYIFLAGLLLMSLGQIASLAIASSFSAIMTRVLVGLGMGLCLPIYGTLTMLNFPAEERPLLNTIFSATPYIATALTYLATVPLFEVSGSWRLAMFWYGVFVIIIALAWGGISRISKPSHMTRRRKEKNLLGIIFRNRQVKLLSVAYICDLWGFNFLSAYLPTYFTAEVGLSLAASSALTSIFPIAGVIAGLGCGLWMTKIGLRKPFTWPMHLMIFVGTILAVLTTDLWRIVGIAMAGFGNAGWAPALFTMPMEFEGMTPERVGVTMAVFSAIGYMGAFVSPLVGGWLGEVFSLKVTLLLFSLVSVLAAIVTFFMQETGPRRKKQCRTIA